jgi:hypothetical protein
MISNLNAKLAQWLEKMEAAAPGSIEREIDNRQQPYPQLEAILKTRPIDTDQFREYAETCTLMTDLKKYADTPLNNFFENKPLAQRLMTRLVERMPRSSEHASIAIDCVIEEAVQKTQLQATQALLLFSLVLTTAHPQRFVDYPARKHWENLAKRLGYGLSPEDTYGSRILWASEFATAIAQTEVFQQHWSDGPYPMWVVSALCWANRDLEEAHLNC